jgi:archaellum component FlaG (FlaF/FlaG flagellin family)
MSKRCNITVEIDGNSVTYEYDNVNISQERGIEKVFGVGVDVIDLVPNGQERITILAWSGVADFDRFEPETFIRNTVK